MALMGPGPRRSRLLGVALLVGGAVACGPTKPACAPESELGKLEAAYVSEALLLCKGYSYSSCPALPKLKAEFHQRVEDWKSCKETAP